MIDVMSHDDDDDDVMSHDHMMKINLLSHDHILSNMMRIDVLSHDPMIPLAPIFGACAVTRRVVFP